MVRMESYKENVRGRERGVEVEKGGDEIGAREVRWGG